MLAKIVRAFHNCFWFPTQWKDGTQENSVADFYVQCILHFFLEWAKVTLTRRRFRLYLQCSHPMAMKCAFIKTEGKILPKGVQIFLWKFSRIIILRAQPKLCRLGVQAAFACIFSDGLELHKRLISICTSEPYLVHVSMTQVSHFSNTTKVGQVFVWL